ncbi:MAG: glycosyltransferase family 2 protein [Pseudomonadota bacterium]
MLNKPAPNATGQDAAWPPANGRTLIVTCMKDEGPFIVEWVAWHIAAGVTDFVVFTNDCSDGTDRILDRLDDLGVVTHLPNPALASESTYFQPAALSYAPYLRNWREADFVISMDVDEFINVRVGQGRLADLFAAAGPFDVLSMTELNHGSNQKEHFTPGWVIDQFPAHQTEQPGKWKAQRGVKSIVRLGDQVRQVRNHRPDMTEHARWLDGSARPLPLLAEDRTANGIDCRGTYELVSLDHFPLRSLDSYLVKMFRGDVVVSGKQVSQRYWRTRNQHDSTGSRFDRLRPEAERVHEDLMGDDALDGLHAEACEAHAARIRHLTSDPHFAERRDWVLANAW